MTKVEVQAKLVVMVLALRIPGAMLESYSLITGYLCIAAEFTETIPNLVTRNPISGCALACNHNWRCQAFSLADGPCQLFVFDRCSKSVRDCSCSRRGRLFVKRQPGLEAGALCPSGYGDDLCGVKYKVHNVQWPDKMTWNQGKEKCETDGGLAMMSDVTSEAEKLHMLQLQNKYMAGIGDMFLGGVQAPGSVEPAGGWSWQPCGIAINASLWTAGQPGNHMPHIENVAGMWGTGIGDFDPNTFSTRGMLCECLSPFD